MQSEALNKTFSKEGESLPTTYELPRLLTCIYALHNHIIKASRLVGITRKQSAALTPLDAKTTSIFSTHLLSIHTSIDWLVGEFTAFMCRYHYI